MPVEGSYGRGENPRLAISGSKWHPPLASAKKQGRSLASSLSFIQCAHGFGEVQHEAEGQAGEAVYDEEGSDAHGLGGHAADRDADRSGEPHGGGEQAHGAAHLIVGHVALGERHGGAVEPGAGYGHDGDENDEGWEGVGRQKPAGCRGRAHDDGRHGDEPRQALAAAPGDEDARTHEHARDAA